MKSVRYVLLSWLTAIVAASPQGGALATPILVADKKPKELVVGKWESLNIQGTVELAGDGTLVIAVEGLQLQLKGKYKFLSDDVMEVEADFMGQTHTRRLTVRVTKDELTTIDEQGTEERYSRIK